jgi:hypothetical protein
MGEQREWWDWELTLRGPDGSQQDMHGATDAVGGSTRLSVKNSILVEIPVRFPQFREWRCIRFAAEKRG